MSKQSRPCHRYPYPANSARMVMGSKSFTPHPYHRDAEGSQSLTSSRMPCLKLRALIAHDLGMNWSVFAICLRANFCSPVRFLLSRVGRSIHPAKVYQLARDFDTSLMATALRCYHLFRVSVFQVENTQVVWGYGAIRKHQDTRMDEENFPIAIAQAMEGISGERSVFLKGTEHLLQWNCVPTQQRALFVLRVKSGRASPTERASS